jgi:hypothetical protein
MLSFVKPKPNKNTERTDGLDVDLHGQGPSEVKRSWRRSRRVSKLVGATVPAVVREDESSHPPSSSMPFMEPASSSSSASPGESLATPTPPSQVFPIADNVKTNRAAAAVAHPTTDSHLDPYDSPLPSTELAPTPVVVEADVPAAIELAEGDRSTNIPERSNDTSAALSQQASASLPLTSGNEVTEVISPETTVSLSEESPASPEGQTEPQTQTQSASHAQDQPTTPSPTAPTTTTTTSSRGFPPPGTLVLVQGVVQTTDVTRQANAEQSPMVASRRRASSMSRLASPSPAAPAGARSRLSTLLNPQSPLAGEATTPAVSASSEQDGGERPPDVAPNSNAIPSSTDPGNSNTISSSSIEVLGTLLSVAAAATAASLLTGSAASNLNGTGSSSPASSEASSHTQNEFGHTARRERMRQAWGNLRERLGLRTQSNVPQAPSAPAPRAGDGLGPDAREMMLTEMARAFNLGLGLDNNGEQGQNPSSPRGTGAAASAAAPDASPSPSGEQGQSGDRATAQERAQEGSFDRFLEDLQADLREVLTSDASDFPSDGEREDDEEQSVPLLSDLPSPRPPLSTDLPLPRRPRTTFARNTRARADNEDASPGLASTSNVSVDSGMPSLASVSVSSDDEDEDDEEDSDSDEDDTEIRMPWESADSNTRILNTGSSGRSPRNVNWWRTYRFSPIPARSIAGNIDPSTVSSRTSSTSSPAVPPPLSSPLSVPGIMSSEAPQTAALQATGSNSNNVSTTTQGENNDVVYPVIVVGLRSVNAPQDRATGVPASPRRTDTPRPTSFPSLASSDSGLDDDAGDDEDQELPEGERPSGASRNVNAQGNNEATPPGSRTFLIFVIGGYYPPGHSMVVGGPNNLGSFEALLELTELLGQVKPTTATRDDIEKSGLEILKASELKEYESAGKITPNCTDRCLICLDDYMDEDDVRLLSCRHAFHKPCVDRWLETGKNSCPACRSKGVPTDGEASSSTAFA